MVPPPPRLTPAPQRVRSMGCPIPLHRDLSRPRRAPGLTHGFSSAVQIDVDASARKPSRGWNPFTADRSSISASTRAHLATGEQVHGARVGLVAGLHPPACTPRHRRPRHRPPRTIPRRLGRRLRRPSSSPIRNAASAASPTPARKAPSSHRRAATIAGCAPSSAAIPPTSSCSSPPASGRPPTRSTSVAPASSTTAAPPACPRPGPTTAAPAPAGISALLQLPHRKGQDGRMFACIGGPRHERILSDMSDAFVIAPRPRRISGSASSANARTATTRSTPAMVKLTLEDTVRLKWRDDDEVVLRCSDPELPIVEDNLVVKAVRALERHTDKVCSVSLRPRETHPLRRRTRRRQQRRRAVLRALNTMAALHLPEDELAAVGATIGSDVPFFIYDRPCPARLPRAARSSHPFPRRRAARPAHLLYKPAFGIAALVGLPALRRLGGIRGFPYAPAGRPWGEMGNHIERPVFEKFPVLGDLNPGSSPGPASAPPCSPDPAPPCSPCSTRPPIPPTWPAPPANATATAAGPGPGGPCKPSRVLAIPRRQHRRQSSASTSGRGPCGSTRDPTLAAAACKKAQTSSTASAAARRPPDPHRDEIRVRQACSSASSRFKGLLHRRVAAKEFGAYLADHTPARGNRPSPSSSAPPASPPLARGRHRPPPRNATAATIDGFAEEAPAPLRGIRPRLCETEALSEGVGVS